MLHLEVRTYQGTYTAELEPGALPDRAEAHPAVRAEIAALNRLKEIAASGPAPAIEQRLLLPIETR